MADRVYPNNQNVDMGSKISFNGIDWSLVEQSMKNNKFAQSDQSSALRSMLDDLMGLPKYQKEEVLEDLEEKVHEEPEETEDESSEESEDHEPEASWKEAHVSNNMRKIAFTHPNQISADAIEAAQAAGDDRLVKTILAARKENRMRIAAAIQQNLEEATRFAQSDSLIDSGSDFSSDPLSDDKIKEMLNDPSIDADTKAKLQSLLPSNETSSPNENMGQTDMPTQDFTTASSFTKSQRTAFVNTAISLGMPIEYINAMCPPQLSTKLASLAEKVKNVYASNLTEDVKTEVVTAMIKEAKLSPESKSEFVDYWNNILGYQDKSFWPSVAEDYTGAKGDK